MIHAAIHPLIQPARLRPARALVSMTAGFVAALSIAVSTVVSITIVSAAAESPTEVAEELAEDGVFVGIGRGSVDETAIIAAVDDARFEGLRIVVVVPTDPQPTPSAFARRIQEATEADAALVFPEDGQIETHVVDDLSGNRIRATERARGLTDPARAVEVFADELQSEIEAETPPLVGRIIRWVILMALAVGAAVLIEIGVARMLRSRAASKA